MISSDGHSAPPLSGVKILELGTLLAGPFACQLLGDLGAEVIKVEPPGSGDPMREWGRDKPYGKSVWWPIIARNKRSIELDLRLAEGQRVLKELVKDADVVVENFRPGTLEKWDLGYPVLEALNPRIVVVRVSGFGQTGPYSDRPGYASVGEAMAGLRYVVGYPDRPPARVGISAGDTMTGALAAVGALAALTEAQKTGVGQVVDAAIYESVLTFMEAMIPEYHIGGYIRERTGAFLPNIAPSNVYPTADGIDLVIAANQDTVFKRLAGAMGRPELAVDDRYSTHSARGKYQAELDGIISAWTVDWEADKLEKLCVENGVPVGRINRAPEILADRHVQARDAIIWETHPVLGDFPMPNVFPKLSRTPGVVNWLGPELGEHNDEILAGRLGLSEDEIARAQGRNE